MITCTKCGEAKPANAFPYDKRKRNGRSSWCRACYVVCHREAKKNWTPEQRERDRNRNRQRAWSVDRVTKRIRRVYGLEPEEWALMVLRQQGCCAICRKEQLKKRLCVDHDHVTGEVRGLLCNVCNRWLGVVGDDAEGARRALEYLRSNVNVQKVA